MHAFSVRQQQLNITLFCCLSSRIDFDDVVVVVDFANANIYI